MIFLRDPETPLFVLNSSSIRFFTCPQINIRSMKPKQITHVGNAATDGHPRKVSPT